MTTDNLPKNNGKTRGSKKLYAAARAAFALCLAAAFAATLLPCTDAGRCVVRVRDEAETAKAVRTETPDDWRGWLAEHGYELNADDEVAVHRVGGAVALDIARAFPVTIKTMLRERTVYTTDTTVASLLAREKVTLGENDEVEPALEAELSEGGVVTVHRVMYAERETTERVNGAVVTRPSPLISNGEVYEASEYYSDGVATRQYRDKYVDGELVSSEILLEDMDPAPINAVTLVGDDSASVSVLDEKFCTALGADGVPLEYERVISEAVCTAYSFSPGVYGSTGMHLFAGCVAVDPEKIPLGSLLYIRSADGAFTYGFAVAADFCEAASWGIVDADLFFETYNESVLFGKRKLDIYVVKQLYQDDLRRYVEDSAAGMFTLRIPAE